MITDGSRRTLVEASNIGVVHRLPGGKRLTAVEGVSLDVFAGETVGLVGESGSGKSTFGSVLAGVQNVNTGNLQIAGRSAVGRGGRPRRNLFANVRSVFQDPLASFNPQLAIWQSLAEPLAVSRKLSNARKDPQILDVCATVGLSRQHLDRYPNELSGGQLQRVAIARALVPRPQLLICDEPVSALDVSVQAQVVNLLKKLQSELGLSLLFISHDLAVVRHMSHRIAVMYLGRIVETGPAADLGEEPLHPYTAALWSAATSPDPEPVDSRPRIILSGDQPSPIARPIGCEFRSRCWLYQQLGRPERCKESPPLIQMSPQRSSSCHFAGEVSKSWREHVPVDNQRRD